MTPVQAVRRGHSVFREYGVPVLCWRAFSYFYKNYLHSFLPETRYGVCSGVTINKRSKLFDRILLSRLHNTDDLNFEIPDYEEALLKALGDHARQGDRVVVVGGGRGVSVVAAAKAVRPGGSVVCFEGNAPSVQDVLETCSLNGVSDMIRVEHAIVGENRGVYGIEHASRTVSGEQLPQCDVLELDCEGAELRILDAISQRPRVIAVETHGFRGSPTSAVSEKLVSMGYRVSDYGLAEPRLKDICEANDIRVLVGVLV